MAPSDSEPEDEPRSLAATRSRRVKTVKSSRDLAFEKLRNIKGSGTKNKYEVGGT